MSSDSITRLNAALEGRYRIERELGEGGMATVYLADDLKHERRVALKVLKPELAAVVGAERFLAEIKTTANLQHPHILPLFDSGEADSFLFYVMPFVQGETLRDRLEREVQLPVDEAVRIATDVAEALHAAHAQGVIHRDIKPANILMTTGRPLVADFGIALAVSAAGGGRMTETGLSMGTPYYMSPEQASADRDPSAASDVYSLGCVLYEMLVGEPPYVGSSAQAVLAKILMGDAPSPTEARASIPAHVDAAIRKSLEKLPADRFADAQELARALGDRGFRHGIDESTAGGGAHASPWRRRAIAATAVAGFMAVAAAWGWIRPSPAATVAVPMRAALLFPTDSGPNGGFALSPDGTRLAFGTVPWLDGGRLWIQSLTTGARRPLAGTERAGWPVWSPDGNRIAFRVGPDLIRVVPAEGGAVVTAVEHPGGVGIPAWHPDGSILFPTEDGILSVPPGGGSPSQVVTTDVGRHAGNALIQVLPDGRGFVLGLGSGGSGPGRGSMYTGDLTTGEVSLALEGAGNARYSDGWLVFRLSGTVLAQRFDPDSRTLEGVAVPIIDDVTSGGGRAAFSVSAQTVVFRSQADQSFWGLRWADRTGGPTLAVLDDERVVGGWMPELARDGAQIAWGGFGLFIADEGGLPRRLEGGGTRAFYPRWSEDGRTLLFSNLEGLVTLETDPGATPTLVVSSGANLLKAVGWGPSGEILFTEELPNGQSDLRALGPGETGQTTTVQAGATDGALSPDGRWLAYVSREGRDDRQIFVRSYRGTEQARVSIDGGSEPRWAPAGDELFFVSHAGLVMSARLSFDGGLRPAAPTHVPIDIAAERVMVHPDGRLLVNGGGGAVERLRVIRDWRALGVGNDGE